MSPRGPSTPTMARWTRSSLATGRTCAVTQSHWFRIEDGKIIEHWANRDDLGMAKQLAWIPPTPAYLFKMVGAKRRAKRSGPSHGKNPRV
jgi:hypothetical protein